MQYICAVMMQTLDILQAAHRDTIDSRMELLELKEHHIPGSAHYVTRRYNASQFAGMEDKGMLVYHYSKHQQEDNFFEMRFCISGNQYCSAKNCLACKEVDEAGCTSHETVDVFSFHFSAGFFIQHRR